MSLVRRLSLCLLSVLVLPLSSLAGPFQVQGQTPPQIDCDELSEQIAAAEDDKEDKRIIYEFYRDLVNYHSYQALLALLEKEFWEEQLAAAEAARDIACAGGSVILCEEAQALVEQIEAQLARACQEWEYHNDLSGYYTFYEDISYQCFLAACKYLDRLYQLQQENC